MSTTTTARRAERIERAMYEWGDRQPPGSSFTLREAVIRAGALQPWEVPDGDDGGMWIKPFTMRDLDGIVARVAEWARGLPVGTQTGAFPISRSRAHTHRRHGHPLQTVPSAGLIERPQEKNRVDALR